MRRLVALTLTLLLDTTANATYTYADYQKIKAEGGQRWAAMQAYLVGVSDGLAVESAASNRTHKPNPFFCPPESFQLNAANLEQILEARALKSLTQSVPLKPEQIQIHAWLFFGLVDAFPCK
jgi:hypothetical protein